MNIITKKVRLIPAPFVGTTIRIRVGDGLVFKFRNVVLAEGCTSITIDWGDGTTEVYNASISGGAHSYPAPGEYCIRISDDTKNICIGFSNDESEYTTVFAPMVLLFTSNAKKLSIIPGYGLCNCINLTCFDVSSSNVRTISSAAFKNCSGLSGELFFPEVGTIQGGATTLPFYGCTGITALHFKEANEAAITSSQAYNADEEHTLGTGVKDVCCFDL